MSALPVNKRPASSESPISDERAPSRGQSRLIAETKQKRSFRSLNEEAVLNVLRTNDRLQIHYTRLFRKFGLTSAQYNILRILRGEGAPLPCLEIASRLIAVVPGITGLIDRLEAAGLVTKRRCTEDRRVIYVDATERALATLAEIDAPLDALHRKLLSHVSEGELQDLIRLLERVREGVDGLD